MNKKHLEIILNGVQTWNEWVSCNPGIRPDLRDADLEGLDLSGINLRGATLNRSRLKGANLTQANLFGTKLHNAYLRRANLTGANLNEASLAGANLRHANLYEAALVNTYLRRADLSYANLGKAILQGTVLEYARFVDTNIAEALIDGCFIYGISVWNLLGTAKQQSNLVISRHVLSRSSGGDSLTHRHDHPEPVITVDDIEVAQLIHLLINHKKLRNVLNTIGERGVLILGRFGGGGIEILRAVGEKLRELKYLPIIFDFDRPRERNFTETVKTLVGLSRFVIVDLSGPSVPQELYATVPHYKVPFIPIIELGLPSYAMFNDLLEYPWVIKPVVRFKDINDLIESLPPKVIAPAEKLHSERQELLKQLFP